MRLGQTFHSYASMVGRNLDRLEKNNRRDVCSKYRGNSNRNGNKYIGYYFDNIVPILAKICAYPLVQVDDLFDATKILMDL